MIRCSKRAEPRGHGQQPRRSHPGGVTDQQQVNRIPGVPDSTVVQIVNACHDRLEPPRQPEVIPVRLSLSGNSYVLVVRADPVRVTRPLLIDGAAPSGVMDAT